MATTTALPLRTGWEVTTPSADTLELAALRAMADRAVAWAEAAGGRSRCDQGDEGVTLADAGSKVPFLNVALAFGPVDVTSVVGISDFFPTVRSFLLVSPHPTPDLSDVGLTLLGHPPFMIRPPSGAEHVPPPGVAVSEVRDLAGLRTWERILAAGYPTAPSPAPAALLGGRTRFWLAHHDGEPVATALSHAAQGVVNVEAVATLPEHRGCGIGAAVTWAATTADPSLPAVLIASDDGVGVYGELGYLAVARWTLWIGNHSRE